jgi:hypothetical protein
VFQNNFNEKLMDRIQVPSKMKFAASILPVYRLLSNVGAYEGF